MQYLLQDGFTFAVTHVVEPLADFGVSGLLAILWLKERRVAQKREDQLAASHERLVQDRVELQALVTVVRANTKTLERFTKTHTRFIRALSQKRARRRKRHKSPSNVSHQTPANASHQTPPSSISPATVSAA